MRDMAGLSCTVAAADCKWLPWSASKVLVTVDHYYSYQRVTNGKQPQHADVGRNPLEILRSILHHVSQIQNLS